MSKPAFWREGRLWFGNRLALCLVFCMAWAGASEATVLTLTQAQATVIVNGVTVQNELQLPYHWDRANPGQQGEAIFNFEFDLPEAPLDVWGIYLPRLGNVYELWLNGVKLQSHGVMAPRAGDPQVYNAADFGRVARYVTVDGAHLHTTNQLRIYIRADVGRRGGLSRVMIGPQDEVLPVFENDNRWRVTGSIAVVAFSFVVAMTALALWSTDIGLPNGERPGRDPLYFFVASAQLFWAVYVGDVLVEEPLLRWPWWGVVQVIALDIWGGSMTLACMELADWRAQWWTRRLAPGDFVDHGDGTGVCHLGTGFRSAAGVDRLVRRLWLHHADFYCQFFLGCHKAWKLRATHRCCCCIHQHCGCIARYLHLPV
jgi:hypothetical protein